jgi:carbonic anhydrase
MQGTELIFDARPGDLYTLRNPGPSAHHAADKMLHWVKYATRTLGCPLILVLGHTQCEALRAEMRTLKTRAFDDDGPRPSRLGLGRCLVSAVHALGGAASDQEILARAAEMNVGSTIDFLQEHSYTIRNRVWSGTLSILGGLYDDRTSRVRLFGPLCRGGVLPGGDSPASRLMRGNIRHLSAQHDEESSSEAPRKRARAASRGFGLPPAPQAASSASSAGPGTQGTAEPAVAVARGGRS